MYSLHNQPTLEPGQYIVRHLYFNVLQANVMYSSHKQPNPKPGQYSNTLVLQCIKIQPGQYSNEYYVTTHHFYNYILLVRFPTHIRVGEPDNLANSIGNTFQYIKQMQCNVFLPKASAPHNLSNVL